MGLKPGAIPVLLFNGIGANIELCRPLSDEMATLGVGTIIFDVPGVGESDPPLVPYRFSDIARAAIRLSVFGPHAQADPLRDQRRIAFVSRQIFGADQTREPAPLC